MLLKEAKSDASLTKPIENLDKSLHKERTSNPNSEFRMTDKEFNENSEKIPHHRYNFDEHISAEGMQNVHWYPKAVGRLKSAVRLAGKGIVKPIILTARSDLKSSTPVTLQGSSRVFLR